MDRRKQGLERSVLVEGGGIPLGRVLAGAHRHDSPLLEPTLDRLAGLGPLPKQVTVHLDAGYDSTKTRTLLADRGLHGEIAHKGEKAPIQARAGVGTSSAPTPGTTASTGSNAATNAANA